MEFKKVVYFVKRVNRDEKFKGIGYLIEDNLLISATSSKGTPPRQRAGEYFYTVFDFVTRRRTKTAARK